VPTVKFEIGAVCLLVNRRNACRHKAAATSNYYTTGRLSSMMWKVGAPTSFRQKEIPLGCHPMLSFRTLEHTADVGFEAYGRSRQEVSANSARALMNIIVDLDSIEPRRESTDTNEAQRKVPGTCEEIDFGHVIHNVTH
jgi:hypothetical protein